MSILLRVRRKQHDGSLARPQWMCPLQFGSVLATITRAKSAMLKFNGTMEIWSVEDGSHFRLLCSNHLR